MNNDILWIEPARTVRSSKGCDVIVSHYASRDKKKMTLNFYNNSWMKVTHHEYLNVGIDTKNMRILLKDPYPNRGSYKLAKVNGPSMKRISLPFCDESFNGEYNLVLDDEIQGAWHTERVR